MLTTYIDYKMQGQPQEKYMSPALTFPPPSHTSNGQQLKPSEEHRREMETEHVDSGIPTTNLFNFSCRTNFPTTCVQKTVKPVTSPRQLLVTLDNFETTHPDHPATSKEPDTLRAPPKEANDLLPTFSSRS